MPNTQLLCTFTYQSKVSKTVDKVFENYTLSQERIFVLQNMREPEKVFLTYNIEKDNYDQYLDKTISIHRKKKTNTLYTINALNQLIIYLNDGILDKTFPIPWENYQNSLLVTDNGEFEKIDTKLENIIDKSE